MKTRTLAIFALLAMLIAASSFAGDWTRREGSGQRELCKQTAPAASSGTAVSGECIFLGIVINTDGSNAVTLTIYDNTAASGTKLIPADFVVPGADYYFGYKPPLPRKCDNGIYVSVSVAGGGSCSYQVFYDD